MSTVNLSVGIYNQYYGLATQTTSTGTALFTFSISSSGYMVLQVTSSAISTTMPLTIGSNFVSLTYSSIPIVNSYVAFTSRIFGTVGNLILGTNTGTIQGSAIGQTITSSSNTGYIKYSVYFTSSGSHSATVNHANLVTALNPQILPNTAIIIPSADFSYTGSSLTYIIYLLNQPVINEIIYITGSSTQFSISPSALAFTSINYNIPQTVTVTILNSQNNGKWQSSINHTNPNMNYISCSSEIALNGTFNLILYNPSKNSVLINQTPVMVEGNSTTYTIVLSALPASSVGISISGPSCLSFSPVAIVFTTLNWNIPQTITVLSQISYMNAYYTNKYQITHVITSSDLAYAMATTIPAIINAYVIAKPKPLVLIYGEMIFQENKGGGYYIVLNSMPTSNVFIMLNSTGTTIIFSPSALIFTQYNYNIPQFIALKSALQQVLGSLRYSIFIVHTAISLDLRYNGIISSPSNSIKVSAIHPCRAGNYAFPQGSGICAPCPLGYSCLQLYGDKVPCSVGQFSLLGMWNCLPCPPHHSCSGLTQPIPCPDGYTSL